MGQVDAVMMMMMMMMMVMGNWRMFVDAFRGQDL
jgi:uncharacterized membrane protein YqhA